MNSTDLLKSRKGHKLCRYSKAKDNCSLTVTAFKPFYLNQWVTHHRLERTRTKYKSTQYLKRSHRTAHTNIPQKYKACFTAKRTFSPELGFGESKGSQARKAVQSHRRSHPYRINSSYYSMNKAYTSSLTGIRRRLLVAQG